jgi:HAD superfamily hydrolase (TIGR01490 family)
VPELATDESLWCRRRDLNPHGLRHTPLKRACLPFHHFGKNHEASLVKRRSSEFVVVSDSRDTLHERRLRHLHYRSSPKFLSMNESSGRIGPFNSVAVVRMVQTDQRDLASTVAAFFDVDNTILPGEASEVRFFRWLWHRGIVGWPEARASVAWLLRHVPPMSLHPLRQRKLYLAGKPAQVIEPLGEEFCREQLCPRVSAIAMRKLDEHRRAGHAIVFVTGSLDFLIAPVADALRADRCFASRLEQQQGLYTGLLVPPLPYGEGKRQLIDQLTQELTLDLSQCYAYGDSPGDVDLLRAVGHPTVVNPIRGMDAIARRHNWPVVKWP